MDAFLVTLDGYKDGILKLRHRPATPGPPTNRAATATSGQAGRPIARARGVEGLVLDSDGRPQAAGRVDARAAHGVRAVSPNGVLGDPAGASAAEGGLLPARLTAALGAALDDLTLLPGASPDILND